MRSQIYRFLFADRLIRLLYYLPMERMRNKDLENAWAVQGIRQEKCAKLEEENKKLKEELAKEGIKMDMMNHYNEIKEENKKLTEENDKLKSDLDRFSEAYKKYRDYEKEELADSCYDFARKNKKLKEEYKALGILNDEIRRMNEKLREKNKKLKEELNGYKM